jgi:hypothetical protein
VALAAAKKNPGLFSGLILISLNRLSRILWKEKQSRNKVLEFIDTHGVEAFTTNFIGPLFSDPGNIQPSRSSRAIAEDQFNRPLL